MKQSRITITIHAKFEDGRAKRGLLRNLKEDLKIYGATKYYFKKVRIRVEDEKESEVKK